MRTLASIGFQVSLLWFFLSFSGETQAQVETVIHQVQDGSVTGEGPHPSFLLRGIDNNFYYVTTSGGATNYGAIYQVTPQGVASIFYSFDLANSFYNPTSLLQGPDGTFYGMTSTNQIFEVTSAGQGSLVYSSAITGLSGLILASDGNLYGTTSSGGTNAAGIIFKLTTGGTLTVLHNFADGSVTNDASYVQAPLVEGTDHNFYGVSEYGGSSSYGTVFKMTPAGTVTILHNFQDGSSGNDGGNPYAPLVEGLDGNFYGSAVNYGAGRSGVLFKITTAGTFTILHNFQDGSTLNDGTAPNVGMTAGSDGNLYGVTQSGGATNGGVAFMLTPQGAILILHSFSDGTVPNDGGAPDSPLVQGADGNFYGNTYQGDRPRRDDIQAEHRRIVLTSPTAASGSVSLPFSYQVTATNSPTSFGGDNCRRAFRSIQRPA